MKFLKSYLILLACLNLTACSPFQKKTTKQQVVSYTPEIRKEFITNNITNTIFLPSIAITNYYTNTVFEVSPEIKTVLNTVQSVNSDYNPTASSNPINLFLVLLSSVLAFIAKKKSDKANLLDTVILGVEATPDNSIVKSNIANTAKIKGVYSFLDSVVQKVVS